MWRRDAAGNESAAVASVPVTLRYDAEAPRLAFTQSPAADPTLISVAASDNVSGLAGGVIELSRQGSGTWVTLPTTAAGDRLVARVDDAALPAGTYAMRARARDRAGNESSTSQALTADAPAPGRNDDACGVRAAEARVADVRRDGKRRRVRRPVTVLRDSATVGLGRRVAVQGRLSSGRGVGVGGATVKVFSRSLTSADMPVAELQTDGQGRFTYAAPGTMSRTLRFVFAGSSLLLPAQRDVRLRVPAASSLRVDRRRVLNGQAVRFSGKVRSVPIPATGKFVELQVRLTDRWQTFRTRRTDAAGRWSVPYRFRRTVGVQRYRFRASAAAGSRVSLYSRHLTVHCCPRQGAVMRSPRNSRHRAGSSDPSTRAKGDRVLDKLRRRLTYANVMSTLAVFIALGGSSYAAWTISGKRHQEPLDRREEAQAKHAHGQADPGIASVAGTKRAERGSPQRRYRGESSDPLSQRHISVS